MTTPTVILGRNKLYPESDGQPMADNTLQFRWIVTIQGGLDALFAARPDVFVAGDLLWYPVEGQPHERVAPDALVAFGRPKGERGSYLQWEEAGIPPQVVFEVFSPGNTPREMRAKLAFYERHGVEEYYEYDPDRGQLRGWLRTEQTLVPIETMLGWISPRLGVRFDLEAGELRLYRPDGRAFESFVELSARAERIEEWAEQLEQRAERAEVQVERAEQHAALEAERAAQAQAHAQRLEAYLHSLGLTPPDPSTPA